MKPRTIRNRMVAMAARWERDLAAIDRMFAGIDMPDHFDTAAETTRNLATAIKHAADFASMTDEGIQTLIDRQI